jgi:acetoin utilization deacetylase AcuC-like enzyme
MIKGKEDILEPREITKRELQMVHTEEYLESLTVINITQRIISLLVFSTYYSPV